MAIVLSGSTNDILVNNVSVATDTEVSTAIIDAVKTGLVALKTIATGTATFTATTNNINLTGIGIGVEIGDVIQISGAEDAKNNSEFTIEVITDNNNIIVNQAHANKGTGKNVATRSGDTDVTVKLLAKWYNAPIGLGQDWVNMTSSRVNNTLYPNNTKRAINIIASSSSTSSFSIRFIISGVNLPYSGTSDFTYLHEEYIYALVPLNSTYKLEHSGPVGLITWTELR